MIKYYLKSYNNIILYIYDHLNTTYSYEGLMFHTRRDSKDMRSRQTKVSIESGKSLLSDKNIKNKAERARYYLDYYLFINDNIGGAEMAR